MVGARMLAYITGTVDQELLLRNEYLAAENRIFKAQIKGRLLLSEGEKATLAEIAYRLGRKARREVAMVAQPEPFWRGIAGSSPNSSRAPSLDALPGPHAWVRTSRVWSCAWQRRTRVGATTASWELWRIWVTKCQTKPWATFCGAMALLPHPSGRTPSVGKISFAPTWRLWRRRTSSRRKS
jgi:hypothetical protein